MNNLLIWLDPYPIAPKDKITRKGKPLASINVGLECYEAAVEAFATGK